MGAREEPDLLALLADALLARVEDLAEQRALTRRAEPTPEVRHDDDGWLRVVDVADRVGASTRTVYRALRSGALAGERLGSHWRIRPEAIDVWMAASPGAKPEPPSAPRSAKAARRGPLVSDTDFKSRARARASERSRNGRPQ